MKRQGILLVIAFVSLGVSRPASAQGAYATTVNTFSSGQTGHSELQLRQQETTQEVYNGFSLATDSQGDSSTNTTTQDGITTTQTYNYGETTTSYSIEEGVYNNTTTVDYFESFDYADFNYSTNLTTGARGERGPRRASDKNRRRR